MLIPRNRKMKTPVVRGVKSPVKSPVRSPPPTVNLIQPIPEKR